MDHLLAALRPAYHVRLPMFIQDIDNDTGAVSYRYQVPYQALDFDPFATWGVGVSAYHRVRIPAFIGLHAPSVTEQVDALVYRRLYDRIVDLGHRGNRSTRAQQHQIWMSLSSDIDQMFGFSHFLLIHSWLGALRRFTNIATIPSDDFFETDPESPSGVSLTTKKLQTWLRVWENRVEAINDDTSRASEVQRAIRETINDAQVLNSLMLFLKDVLYPRLSADTFSDSDPLGMTHFACMLMLQALRTAVMQRREADYSQEIIDGLRVPWLRRRLELDRWCPYIVSKIFATCELDQLAVIYAIGSARSDRDHVQCTTARCALGNTSETQELKHICSEGCVTKLLPVHELVSIIQQGDIPVLQVSETGDIEIRPLTAGQHGYIAVSHVWADGLGALSSNAIATCQLRRLKQCMLDIEAAEACGELCVWIDSLCIPVGNDYQHLRNNQIMKMTTIYREAFGVLVIDADMSRISPGATLPDIAARLTISTWSTRLWTYQEGMLSRRLFLTTRSGVVDLDALTSEALKLETDQIPPDHNLLDKAIRTIINIGRPLSCARFPDGRRRPGDVADIFNALQSRQDGQRTLHSIQHRTSTRSDDETIIIGIALSIDTSSITIAPPDTRMIALLRSMPVIPVNLLFSLGPRLTLPGFRWAPASVLRAKNGSVVTLVDDMIPLFGNLSELIGRPESRLAPEGLLTCNPALRLSHNLPESSMPSLACRIDERIYAIVPAKVDSRKSDVDYERLGDIEALLRQRRSLVVLLPEFNPQKIFKWGVVAELLSESAVPEFCSHSPATEEATRIRYCMPVRLLPKTLLQALPEKYTDEETAAIEKRVGSVDGRVRFGPMPPPEMLQHRQREAVNAAETRAQQRMQKYDAKWIKARWWLID